MIPDILELQYKLTQAQNNGVHPLTNKIRIRTAAVEDVRRWLKAGYSTKEVADILGEGLCLSPLELEAQKAGMEEENQRRRKFLATGHMESQGGYFAIMQR